MCWRWSFSRIAGPPAGGSTSQARRALALAAAGSPAAESAAPPRCPLAAAKSAPAPQARRPDRAPADGHAPTTAEGDASGSCAPAEDWPASTCRSGGASSKAPAVKSAAAAPSSHTGAHHTEACGVAAAKTEALRARSAPHSTAMGDCAASAPKQGSALLGQDPRSPFAHLREGSLESRSWMAENNTNPITMGNTSRSISAMASTVLVEMGSVSQMWRRDVEVGQLQALRSGLRAA
mmetsp:Transcript_92866/g.246695  ORF Transcript_92866/g.246695 Transcript_92866/m.246695 type:complete len:236 (-) Transcript_92866:12-719(-)